MKNAFIFLLVFIVQFLSFSQNRKKIDSINNISLQVKLEKASIFQNVFLNNASNANKIHYQLGEAESYSNLALLCYYLGNFENDLKYSLKSISIFEKIGNIERSRAFPRCPF